MLQYAESLSDRQAAEAVRGRIDWKYVLGLELTDPSFDSSVLREFRTRIVAGDAVHQLLDILLIHDLRLPKGDAARAADARMVGEDGHQLRARLAASDAPVWLRELPAVETLRRVWVQQFYLDPASRVHWRTAEHGLPPARTFLSSPYELEAHHVRKHTASWIGYKVHFTEGCDDKSSHLITHVETTSGPVADGEAAPRIHAALARRDLLPACHVVDTGYVDAAVLVASERDYAVDLDGLTRLDYRWQARAETGFDAAHFVIDWAKQRVTCPAGRAGLNWTPAIDNRKHAVVKDQFSRKDRLPCSLRQCCTRAFHQAHEPTPCETHWPAVSNSAQSPFSLECYTRNARRVAR